MNLKKTIICILSILCLVGCSSNSSNKSSSKTSSQNIDEETQIDGNGNTRLNINAANFAQHFNCTVTRTYRYDTDYSTYKTYTANVTFEIKQLRQGFVTYSGSANLLVTIGWNDSTSQHKTKNVEIPMRAYDYLTLFSFSKSFDLTIAYSNNKNPNDDIPYNADVSIDNFLAKNSQIIATYYKNGISGDDELSVKSYKITIANYSVYLTMGSDHGKSYIYPLNTSELYDYRITMTIEGKKYILRRDGRYYFDILFENPLITSVEGYIDVYPGRVI